MAEAATERPRPRGIGRLPRDLKTCCPQHRYRIPMLMKWMKNDRAISVEVAKRAARRIQGSKTTTGAARRVAPMHPGTTSSRGMSETPAGQGFQGVPRYSLSAWKLRRIIVVGEAN